MPYRRLPNTDQARLRSLKAACEKVVSEQPIDLKFSQKLAIEVQAFTPQFEQAVAQYVNSRNLQAQFGKALADSAKNARLYLSHFLQVFNLCVLRSEIKPEMRRMFMLSPEDSTVPDISTDNLLMDWCEKIISGEEKRMATSGGNRIYNPSIAVVKVKYELFRDSYNRHKDLLVTTQKHHEKLDDMRRRADELILSIWNEVEESQSPIDTEDKRNLCTEYGIVYFYRPYEKQKDILA